MKMNILLAQINPCVGDIHANQKKITDILLNHQQYDIIIFPELAVCGYPPEDLLFYSEFLESMNKAIEEIAKIQTPSIIILGTVHQGYNAAAFIQNNKIQYYYKHTLPNYGVFDEKRYFKIGDEKFFSFEYHNHRFGLMICEDIWASQNLEFLKSKPIDTLISINASPYEMNKKINRETVLQKINELDINTIYVNQVGGQDGLVFDGQSMVFDQKHQLMAKAKAFHEDLLPLHFDGQHWEGTIAPALSHLEEVYQAISLGLSDFMKKNGFQKAVLGLSGGIDAALTLAIASDAIGSQNIHAILMPSQYTASASIQDAIQQAKTLNVSYEIIHIEPLVDAFKKTLNNPSSITLQNLQARIRGVLLMAYSNEHQALLLNTSNKSEIAVGYGTLYGDMCGGYAPLQDLYKTKVYELAHFRNKKSMVIPQHVITRAPSAELAPNQTDQDDLPPYDILDQLLVDVIEKRFSEHQLNEKYGIPLVEKILKKIKISEFKRFQAPPGCKITAVAFGKDWRIPITHHWKI